MKKYEIEINNEIYHVSVRELSDDKDMQNEQVSPVLTTESNKKPESANQTTPSGSENEVTAPMPGTILNIKVTPKQTVKQGDTLIILEAMKMENEIVSPADGVVGEIHVKQNERVESDQVLLTI